MSLRQYVLAVTASCLPGLSCASGPQLQLPAFEHLQQLATDSVNLSIGPSTVALAARWLGRGDGEDEAFAQLLRGVRGIYIRSYEFARDDAYPAEEVEAVRRQLSQSDWTPVTQVKSRRDGENVDIFLNLAHDKVEGMALIASDRRKFTILNVVGSFDLRQLATLERQFGLSPIGR